MQGSRVVWTPAMDRLLGTMPDTRVAKKIGFSAQIVSIRRHELGIPPYRRLDWTKADRLLGKVPDSEVARIVGTTQPNVTYRRRKKGIPALGRWPKKARS